jgi:hypothetical protein
MTRCIVRAMSPERSASYETQKTPAILYHLRHSPPPTKEGVHSREAGVIGRRSFLRKVGIVGVSLAPATALLLTDSERT